MAEQVWQTRAHPRRPSARAGAARGLPQVYRGRGRRTLSDVYDADHAGMRRGRRFRWLLSTCLAAAVGTVAVTLAIYGSLSRHDSDRVVFDNPTVTPPAGAEGSRVGSVRWSAPKSDRLQFTTDKASTFHIVHDQIQVRRENRPFIQIRPYVRLQSRLQPVSRANSDVIPPFNPLQLYAAEPGDAGAAGSVQSERIGEMIARVVELLGGAIPVEDGQELAASEAESLVSRVEDPDDDAAAVASSRGLAALAGRELDIVEPGQAPPPAARNTTTVVKSVAGSEAEGDRRQPGEVTSVKAARGDTLVRILQRNGAEGWQAKLMAEAARTTLPEHAFAAGFVVEIAMVPSLSSPGRKEPSRFSVFDAEGAHKVTVWRAASGEFRAAQDQAAAGEGVSNATDSDVPQAGSLYASLYSALLTQGLGPEAILKIMRIHAYETDFRRRVGPSDQTELFFETKEDHAAEPEPDELLFTALMAGGEARRYWRFRTPDGIVDYYDELGHNSRRFLMRRPIRGDDVRLTSGYGMRFHPLLNERRMHTGVDWSAPVGTPILSAGSGEVEEADRKGHYGNYVRIRHANGYDTAYAHMLRIAPGIVPGAKVRQGTVIGFVGSTGLSSGPHLHYEVLVNKRFVDPLTLNVPRERRLSGRVLADFQKERGRIEDLMRRPPVKTLTR